MSRPRYYRWLPVYQWLAGLCDSATGASLVFAPAGTLALIGVRNPPQPPEFAAFTGVFVLSVGLACLYAAVLPRTKANAPYWRAVWGLTATTRLLVAAFLLWKILSGRLEPAWVTVALTDASLGVFQCVGLLSGWLRFGD
jgi:hypothetical protein